MKKMFERHRGNDSIDVIILITILYLNPSMNAIQPVCTDIVANSHAESLCSRLENVLREKSIVAFPE